MANCVGPDPLAAMKSRSAPQLKLSGTFAVVGSGALLVLVGFLLFRDVGSYFVNRWIAEKEYHHCFLVLPLIGWLIWRQRESIISAQVRPSPLGLLVLLLGALLYLLSTRVGARVLVGFSLPVLLIGLGWSWLGLHAFRPMLAPAMLSIFLVPVPRHLMGMIAMPMQLVSAKGAGLLGNLMGVPTQSDGVVLTTPYARLVVAQECSGLNSLLALLLIACVVVHLVPMSAWRKLVLLLTIPIIVLAANVLRLIIVLLSSVFIGGKFATDALAHGTTDVIVYLGALIGMVLVAERLRSFGSLRKLGEGGEESR